MKKILLLGNTGKMGLALTDLLKNDYVIEGKNSKDFDAENFPSVRSLIEDSKPDIVINTAALLGIDPCEENPEKAFQINTLYPKFLAELSNKHKFILCHFSTDAVFNDDKRYYRTEADLPAPLNIYGMTKYGGDCCIQAGTEHHYIFRIPILFGETYKNNQFVEKMIDFMKKKPLVRVSSDIFSSPTYSRDVAEKIKEILIDRYSYGLYHIANRGVASLFDLMNKIKIELNLPARVESASYKDFPFKGRKNLFTPLSSSKLISMRSWEKAVIDYCIRMKGKP